MQGGSIHRNSLTSSGKLPFPVCIDQMPVVEPEPEDNKFKVVAMAALFAARRRSSTQIATSEKYDPRQIRRRSSHKIDQSKVTSQRRRSSHKLDTTAGLLQRRSSVQKIDELLQRRRSSIVSSSRRRSSGCLDRTLSRNENYEEAEIGKHQEDDQIESLTDIYDDSLKFQSFGSSMKTRTDSLNSESSNSSAKFFSAALAGDDVRLKI